MYISEALRDQQTPILHVHYKNPAKEFSQLI